MNHLTNDTIHFNGIRRQFSQAAPDVLNHISKPNTAIKFIDNLLTTKNDAILGFPLVQRLMLALANNYKVFRSIVGLIPIDVMNSITREEFPSNKSSGNLSMFLNSLNFPISKNNITSLTIVLTNFTAKLTCFFDGRSDKIDFTTKIANDISLFEMGTLSAFHGLTNLFGTNWDIELSGTIPTTKSLMSERFRDEVFLTELTSLFYKYLLSTHNEINFDKDNKTLLVSQVKDENGEPLVVYQQAKGRSETKIIE